MKHLFITVLVASVAFVHGQARLEFDFNNKQGGYDTYELVRIDRLYFSPSISAYCDNDP